MYFAPVPKKIYKKWSWYAEKCFLCEANDVKHYSKGYCKRCYTALYRQWQKNLNPVEKKVGRPKGSKKKIET